MTEAGVAMRNKIQPTMYKLRAITTNGISDDDLRQTLMILEKMLLNMHDKVSLQI